MGWLMNPEVWASLVTLTALEIVLGIDNLVFIAILAGRLPPARQNSARRLGLALALISRLALLACIAWIIGLTLPVFDLFNHHILAGHRADGGRFFPALQGYPGDPSPL
jgi:predicted tellurium resistance membrane protein TerC